LSGDGGVWVLLALLLCTCTARADIFALAELRLQAGAEPGAYELTARLPQTVPEVAELAWPAGCEQVEFRRQWLGQRAHLLYRARCVQTPAPSAVIHAPWRVDGARLTVDVAGKPTTFALSRTDAGIAVPLGVLQADDRSALAIAPPLTWQGMLHIWQGWDHLAFVLCLCVLARGWQLLGLVTAFTLGHSVSLALAFFDVLRLAGPPTEALIALSIVLVAREGLLAQTSAETSRSPASVAVIVTVFGVVHGLGFATALRELGVAAGERWPALIFFNLGVELGQVAFVALVLAAGWLLQRAALDAPARCWVLYATGIVGSFWLVERVAAYGWT
jgi:hypothetical protein